MRCTPQRPQRAKRETESKNCIYPHIHTYSAVRLSTGDKLASGAACTVWVTPLFMNSVWRRTRALLTSERSVMLALICHWRNSRVETVKKKKKNQVQRWICDIQNHRTSFCCHASVVKGERLLLLPRRHLKTPSACVRFSSCLGAACSLLGHTPHK